MKTKCENKTTKILFHAISYYYDNGMDMPETEEEHVSYMITQGFHSGELCYLDTEDNEQRGWWHIDFGDTNS